MGFFSVSFCSLGILEKSDIGVTVGKSPKTGLF